MARAGWKRSHKGDIANECGANKGGMSDRPKGKWKVVCEGENQGPPLQRAFLPRKWLNSKLFLIRGTKCSASLSIWTGALLLQCPSAVSIHGHRSAEWLRWKRRVLLNPLCTDVSKHVILKKNSSFSVNLENETRVTSQPPRRESFSAAWRKRPNR